MVSQWDINVIMVLRCGCGEYCTGVLALVLLGKGMRLFDHLGTEHLELERTGFIVPWRNPS